MSGITVIELLIVVAILGVLAGVAAPAFTSFIAERSVTAETRRVISMLKLARSEARARGAVVTLSRASAQASWSGAVDIYEDVDGPDDAYEPANGDDLIRQEEASGRMVETNDNQGGGDFRISFNMQGWLSETGSVLISVCSDILPDSQGSYIEINRVGKIRERRIGNAVGGCL